MFLKLRDSPLFTLICLLSYIGCSEGYGGEDQGENNEVYDGPKQSEADGLFNQRDGPHPANVREFESDGHDRKRKESKHPAGFNGSDDRHSGPKHLPRSHKPDGETNEGLLEDGEGPQGAEGSNQTGRSGEHRRYRRDTNVTQCYFCDRKGCLFSESVNQSCGAPSPNMQCWTAVQIGVGVFGRGCATVCNPTQPGSQYGGGDAGSIFSTDGRQLQGYQDHIIQCCSTQNCNGGDGGKGGGGGANQTTTAKSGAENYHGKPITALFAAYITAHWTITGA